MAKRKREYSLVGVDGNAYCVRGYVSRAMRERGKTKAEIDAYFDDAKSADYNHLIAVSDAVIQRLNMEAGK